MGRSSQKNLKIDNSRWKYICNRQKFIACFLAFMEWLLYSPAGAGRFEIDGGRLRFGPMVSTRMACPADMDLERQFLEALAQVERYRMCGSILEILDVSGNLLAQFASDGK